MPHFTRAALAAAVLACAALPAGAQPVVTLPAQDRALRADGPAVFAAGGLAQPVAAGFDRAGNLYVLDRARRQVAAFDPAGRPLRRMGSPGELTMPLGLAVADDGTVTVQDLGRGLVSWGPDGRPRGVRAVPGLEPRRPGVIVLPHPRGGIVAEARPVAAARAPAGSPLRTATALAWIGPTGAPRELLVASAATEAEVERLDARTGGGAARVSGPIIPVFSPEVRWALLPDAGFALATAETYRVQVAGADGRVLRVLRRAVAPRRVSAADRERMLARQGRPGPAGPGPAPGTMMMGVSPSDVPFADVMPVIQGIVADPQGRIWVARSGPVYGQPGPVDVLRPDGAYLGTLPAGPLPAAFSRGGTAAYFVPDAGGGMRVEVRRLPSALR
jgi:hypothetical protein